MLFLNNRFMYQQVFFAPDGGGGAGGEGDGGGAGGDGGNGGGSGSEGNKLSFDDFLKVEGNQAEFDRRVQKAIDTAVSNAQEKWRILADDKASEAEKLAKMTKEEKNQYLYQKKVKELDDRDSEITKRELMAEAKNTLAEKKLPVQLADILNYKDAESCKASMETLEKTFQEAVQAAVEEKLKGGDPPRKPPEGDDLEKQIEKMIMGY